MLYPMFALVIFTLIIAGYLLSLRIKAVKSGAVRISYFRTYRTKSQQTKGHQTSGQSSQDQGSQDQGSQDQSSPSQGEQEPEEMIQASRNYSNLFEMPVLFYAAGCTSLAMKVETTAILILAWLYVLARFAHSYVHLTFNNVVTRLQIFMFSNLCLAAIWVLLIVAQLKR